MGASAAPMPLRQGDDPPGPATAMEDGCKTKQFARFWYTSPGEFLGKRKANRKPWREQVFSTAFSFAFPRCALRTAGQRMALAAQER